MKYRKPSRKAFAKRLNRKMCELGIDVNQLSRAANINPRTLHGYTNGSNFPTWINAEKLHKALNWDWGEMHGC